MYSYLIFLVVATAVILLRKNIYICHDCVFQLLFQPENGKVDGGGGRGGISFTVKPQEHRMGRNILEHKVQPLLLQTATSYHPFHTPLCSACKLSVWLHLDRDGPQRSVGIFFRSAVVFYISCWLCRVEVAECYCCFCFTCIGSKLSTPGIFCSGFCFSMWSLPPRGAGNLCRTFL